MQVQVRSRPAQSQSEHNASLPQLEGSFKSSAPGVLAYSGSTVPSTVRWPIELPLKITERIFRYAAVFPRRVSVSVAVGQKAAPRPGPGASAKAGCYGETLRRERVAIGPMVNADMRSQMSMYVGCY